MQTYLGRLLHPLMKTQVVIREKTKSSFIYILNTKAILKVKETFSELLNFVRKCSADLVQVSLTRVSEERKRLLNELD